MPTHRHYPILSIIALSLACSDDGTLGESQVTTHTEGVADDTGGGDAEGSTGASVGATANADDAGSSVTTVGETAADSTGSVSVSTGGDTTGDDGTTGGGDSPDEVCPPAPYPASPFSGETMVTATPIAGSAIADFGGMGVLESPESRYEGPVWLGDSLIFSHFQRSGSPPPSQLIRYTPPGDFELANPGVDTGTNGLALRSDGALVGASHAARGLVLIDAATGTVEETLVGDYEGTPFNSPNDLTLRSDGNIYFTDPDYQAVQPTDLPTAAYRVDPQGTVTQFLQINEPNGIALSPDEMTLYVGHPGGLLRFNLAADGSVMGEGTAFGPPAVNNVDGLAIDCAGNIYVSIHSEGRIQVLAPDGTQLGTIGGMSEVTNAAFGGPNRTTLYITAGNPGTDPGLYSVDLEIPGYPY